MALRNCCRIRKIGKIMTLNKVSAPLNFVTVRKQVHWATDLKRGDVVVSVEAHNAVTVEREEPAPEPEFAWKTGTPGTAVLGGDPEPVWYVHREVAPGEFEEEWIDDQGQTHVDSGVSLFEPSVVVDPSEARATLGREFPSGMIYGRIEYVLSCLGVEAS